MILFLDDYRHYPNAIIDYETPNTSFLELAKLYRDMGIKNNVFHLVLLNPELQGVDPHSPNLTLQQKLAIAVEIKTNPFYFLREVAKAPARGSQNPVPVRANRANIALFWCFLNHCQIFLIQPRQTGKSFNTDILMRWLMDFRCDNTEINLLTKDDGLRRNNIQRLKDIAEDFPDYLQFKTRDDVNNGEEITVKALGNIYKTHVPQASPKRALNLGRGLTTAIFQVDEAPFCPNIEISMPAAFAAMGAAVEEAKRNNAPYGTIITTTAGKKDDKDGKYIYGLLKEAAVWNEKYFDCANQEEFEEMVRADSNVDRTRNKKGVFRINATFSHRQLGFSDEWLAQRLEDSLSTDDAAARDFFNIWTSGSEKSPFPPHIAEAIALSKMDPITKTISDINRYITNWYIEEDEIEHYMANRDIVFAVDASENIGRDETTLHLLDIASLRTIATGSFNNTNVYQVGEHILNMMIKYPRLTGVVESKNMGVALLNYLLLKLPLAGFNPFKRLFNRIVQERDDNEHKKEMYEEIKKYGTQSDIINKYRNYFGYPTSGTGAYSRDVLYGSVFKIAVDKAKDVIFDETLAQQLLELTIRNGRIDHEEGGHDDMVVAWLLNMWFMLNGKNLEFYGIRYQAIMSESNKPKQLSLEELIFENEQNRIRNEMVKLYEELDNEDDDFIAMKLEQRLRILNRKIVLREHETYSIDALINQVKEKRKERRRLSASYDRMRWN